MKSNKMKIISVFLLIFVLLVGGVFYYASTKLNPEEIRKLAVEQTKKIFPNAEVELGNVNIAWGLNFKVELQKFSLKTIPMSGDKVDMMSVDELVVKIPLWAIITNGGVIEIQLDKPLVNYAEFTESNNWVYAMGTKASDKTAEEKVEDKKDQQATGESSASAVGLFGKSKINVKVSDVAIRYSLRDNSKGQISVSRFLIKGLNFESSTAFEVASGAEFVMKDKSKVSFNTIAIGEINIADLVKNGSVTSLVLVKVNNISKTGLEWKFPEVTTNLNVLLKKDGELSGTIQTSFENQNKISANFKMTKEISISDINVDIVLKDIALIMGLDRTIDLSRAKLSAKGSVLYTEDKKIDANLNFSITPGIGYSHDGLVATTTASGEFKKKDIAIRVKTDVLEGVVQTLINGEYDPNQKFDMKTLKPFDIKLTASGMKIPEKLIRAKLWTKKEGGEDNKEDNKEVADTNTKESPQQSKATEADSSSGNESNKAEAAMLPPSNITLQWSGINVGGEDFSGKGRIVTSAQALAIDNLNFKFSKGTGKLSQTMKMGAKSSESNFNFEVSELNLSSFKAFLPPFIENFTGTFSGKVSGNATMYKALNKAPRFDVGVAIDAKKGEVKKLNISDYVNPLLSNIPIVKDQVQDKALKIDGNFETLAMKGRFTNEEYNLSSFNFVGINKKAEINGSGILYPLVNATKMSTMEVTFTENGGKIGDVLQKNIGTRVLPMRLSGPGFSLKPDYQYTLSKVAKGAVKTKGEEIVKKVIDKNLDKIVPAEAKEKVQGILNGLFKKK